MWRRLYLFLALVRLFFALSPSYIHPDEHFQAPEVIAGDVLAYPIHRTWEFTCDHPIRSIFPLWLIYVWPLTVLQWIYEGLGYSAVPPMVAFYVLRALMFMLSFVLEDWALHELFPVTKERRVAIMLVASSYVTWTYQSHTFSNSVEALIVLWCLVLIARIRDDKEHVQTTASIVLAFLGVLGVFNRITFPAFLVIPVAQLLPHFRAQPLSLLAMIASGLLTTFVAILMDTTHHHGSPVHFRQLHEIAVIAPLNNLMYNLDSSNLAKHGLHPFYQHFLVNLPQLLGPAILLVMFSSRRTSPFWSAILGIATLSCFKHQEARFLLPAVPLLLGSVTLPKKGVRVWTGAWIIFNIFAGVLFGVYHQGGVMPAQAWIARQDNVSQAFWWKTYSPPTWLLGSKNVEIITTDLMGMPGDAMVNRLLAAVDCGPQANSTLLVAPQSALFLDRLTDGTTTALNLDKSWAYKNHIGLDDMNFGDDGIWPTLQRVVGRRGLGVWSVTKMC